MLRVRLRRQARRVGAVALRAAVGPAAELRVPGVRRTVAVLCPLLWHWLMPQEPNVPPVAATGIAAAGAYVKLPLNVTDPFPCVVTVAVAWQSLHTAPAPVERRQVRPVRVAHQRVRRALWHSVQLFVAPPSRRVPGVRRHRLGALPVVVAEVDPAAPERAAGGRHRVGACRRVREAPVERHRTVRVRVHRRRRVAVVADRPGARRGRQVRPVRVAHQRVRQGAVALRAAVRPAAEHHVPRVRRHRRALCPLLWQSVDPAGPERPAGRRNRSPRPART